jgi:hypothetical protein
VLKTWPGVHRNIVGAILVETILNTGEFALASLGIRGLHEVPAVEHEAYPPTMGAEPHAG